MKVKVTQTFRDKDDYTLTYKVGEEREFNDARALNLIALGLVEPISIAQEPSEELFPIEGKRKRGRKSYK